RHGNASGNSRDYPRKRRAEVACLTDSEKISFAGSEAVVKPGTGVGPVAVGRGPRDGEKRGGFLGRQPAAEPQTHEFGFRGILGRGGIERVGQIEEVVRRKIVNGDRLTEVESLAVATVLRPALRPRPVDEDVADDLGSGGEEMVAIGPSRLRSCGQSQ